MHCYMDLIIRADSRSEAGMLISEAFSRLHSGIQQIAPGRIGVAFPNIREGDAPHPGNVLRVFGSEKELDSLRNLDGLTHLERAGGLVRGKILSVPGDHGWVRFVRDRVVEQATDEAIARTEARFVERYRAMHNREPTQKEIQQRRRALRQREGKRPFLRLRSSSTGRLFSVHIRREPGSQEVKVDRFSGYGLAPAYGPCLPDFPTAEPSL